MKVIGIDIGTTSICGILADIETGCVIKSRTLASNAFLKGCAEWEKIQSVEKIILTANEILEEFLSDKIWCGDICAIGVTGQMHGIVYINAEGGAESPLYIWQDSRGNLPFEDTTYAKYLNSFSGYGGVTDFYNRKNGLVPKKAVGYCTIHDYFVMRLCGLKKPVIHSSDAASFGFYDLEANKPLIDFGAEITSDYRIAGEYKKIPVAVAIGDNQASVFSTLANEDDVLLNVGTGSQVSVVSPKPINGENIETRPYFEGKYLAVGSALCGGRAYSLLKDFYSAVFDYSKHESEETVYGIMGDMLKKAERSQKGDFLVDTRFAGTRCDSLAKGKILGITTENFTPENLTFGVLFGMANELFEMYKHMNSPKSGIVGSGNGLRKNAALVKIFEDMFGAKMKMPSHFEEASFGAALFGAISCGALKNAEEACSIIKYEER